MADPNRYRGDPSRPWDDDREERGRDGGYIAQRGFGNDRSGYGRGERGGGDPGRHRSEHESGRSYGGEYGGGYGRERNRDYGDSSGYGTGGSSRDFREVTGRDYDDDRFRRPDEFFRGSRGGGSGEYGRGGYNREYGSGSSRDYGSGQGRGYRDERNERGFFERAGDEVASWFGDDEAERRRRQDAREGDSGAQHHRGRGPKNYTRSDDRIRDDINDRLTDDPHIDASDVEVTVQNREVTLTGVVQDRWAKRHAEDIAERVSGVTHVQNNLRVRQSGAIGTGSTAVTAGAEAAGSGTTGSGSTASSGGDSLSIGDVAIGQMTENWASKDASSSAVRQTSGGSTSTSGSSSGGDSLSIGDAVIGAVPDAFSGSSSSTSSTGTGRDRKS